MIKDIDYLERLASVYNKARQENINEFYVSDKISELFGCDSITEFVELHTDMKFIYRLAEIIDFKHIPFKRKKKDGEWIEIPTNIFKVKIYFEEGVEENGLVHPKLIKQLRHFTKNPNINPRRKENWNLMFDKGKPCKPSVNPSTSSW